RTVRERFYRECTLRAGWDEIASVEFDELNVADSPEAFHPRHRDYDRVEAAVGDTRDARIDVAAQRDNFESTIYARCLEATPRRRGSELSTRFESRQRGPAPRHEHVGGILALDYRRDSEFGRQDRGEIFHRMNRDIDSP